MLGAPPPAHSSLSASAASSLWDQERFDMMCSTDDAWQEAYEMDRSMPLMKPIGKRRATASGVSKTLLGAAFGRDSTVRRREIGPT